MLHCKVCNSTVEYILISLKDSYDLHKNTLLKIIVCLQSSVVSYMQNLYELYSRRSIIHYIKKKKKKKNYIQYHIDNNPSSTISITKTEEKKKKVVVVGKREKQTPKTKKK